MSERYSKQKRGSLDLTAAVHIQADLLASRKGILSSDLVPDQAQSELRNGASNNQVFVEEH